MADEEQFSLCWNNFNTNLSAGFHESLCRGDLVDVTLAAEGQLVKAHRLVLSVCSPYFRKMFTQMPANQHAFVFLKDVSSSALKDLIQFMYCGEVNVRQEALPAFISTAEALQIKGLTESNEAVTATGSSSPTKEVITSTPLPDTASIRARGTVRSVSNRPQAFKIESEGSSDEKQTVTLVQNQPVKRIARQSIPTSAPKRVKTQLSQETPDPLDAPDHEIVTPQQLKETTEFIDLPIETTSLNPKTEPEYVEDTQEIETEQDDDNQYVEDVTYGEEKYEESYFTEGDDNKAGVSGFSETYATEGDQSATEAQEYHFIETEALDIQITPKSNKKYEYVYEEYEQPILLQDETELTFVTTPWSTKCLVHNNFLYNCHSTHGNKIYYRCHNYSKKNKDERCRARCLISNGKIIAFTGGKHNHPPHTDKIERICKKERERSTKGIKIDKMEKLDDNLY
ncbi:modifier of mdg4-like isoform X4 [Chironomus tepperi]|uniref:modifier of mdg4-like isoform X4 n=1 Tax=Chironomus tepperi TaxID=113505 RepID=UPI00391F192D